MLSSTFSLRVASIIALLFAGCGMRTDMTPEDIDGEDSIAPSGGTSSASSVAGGARASASSSRGATPSSSGGGAAIPSGGVSAIPSGGASATPSGGALMTSSRSSSSLPSGGATPIAGARASGGTTASTRTGGVGMPSGGTTVRVSSGSGGAPSPTSSSTPLSCTGVICPTLPKTCKKIVQDPSACCPACIDTGCPPCGDIKCAPGTHSETLPGDCCPSCVADPLDACKKGQKAYEELRKQLLDKYSSTKCQNSLECSLVLESNACTTVCNVPLPTSRVRDYQDNLASSAKTNCASCPTQAPVMCERMVASCLNGKCVAANPS